TIFPYWPAQGSSELVAPEWWNRGRIEIIPRIQRAIAQKFIDGPVQRICALPGNGIDYPTGSFAVVRCSVRGDDRELLDGINSQVDAEGAARTSIRVVVNAHPINAIIILLRAPPGDCEL